VKFSIEFDGNGDGGIFFGGIVVGAIILALILLASGVFTQ
jgi:hypothetical protein